MKWREYWRTRKQEEETKSRQDKGEVNLQLLQNDIAQEDEAQKVNLQEEYGLGEDKYEELEITNDDQTLHS
ncbi:hypothetical protein BGZ76_006021 [Entomortierella beljakovae]|nr:hypothetical protein BGZ76_006021 [Entomortierella beljakovae]